MPVQVASVRISIGITNNVDVVVGENGVGKPRVNSSDLAHFWGDIPNSQLIFYLKNVMVGGPMPGLKDQKWPRSVMGLAPETEIRRK